MKTARGDIPAERNGHGEVCAECQPVLALMQERLVGLEMTLRMQASKLGRMERERDPEARAREHARWQEIQALFETWRVHCRHPRAKFSARRFQVALPFFEGYGPELCERAVMGASFDPWETKRKNGSTKRHDGWELVFQSEAKFEEFANRAPRSSAVSSSVPTQQGERDKTSRRDHNLTKEVEAR